MRQDAFRGRLAETESSNAAVSIPRILLGGSGSGSGKTLLTCGFLRLLSRRGLRPVSFKCGPDYIDPMFHRTVLGTPSYNLDTFFTDEQTTRYLLGRHAAGADLAVVEGVMGYYDGLGGSSTDASTWDVARITQTPAVLVVNCKGMSLSAAALIKGFAQFRPESRIKGVILNRISPMLYERISEQILKETQVRPLGFVPEMKEFALESRYLGLVLPEEVPELQEKIDFLAETMEKTLDVNDLLSLAQEAPPISVQPPEALQKSIDRARELAASSGKRPVIAVARDEAFCFLYEDNLQLLRDMGAEPVFFSPLKDRVLPDCDGLLLCGGYPELHLQELSENKAMRKAIRNAVAERHLPTLAECGGFMYLLQEIKDGSGRGYTMAGALPGSAYRTDAHRRFGYVTLIPNGKLNETMAGSGSCSIGKEKETMTGPDPGPIRAHEYHYYDATDCGDAFRAEKPIGNRSWDCMHAGPGLLAGFPHLYYYANPTVALRFLETCIKSRTKQKHWEGKWK